MHIAVIGSGQLARMMALAGIPFGFTFSFLAEENDDTSCVFNLGNIVRYRESVAADELYAQLGEPVVVTAEKEQIDVGLLKALQPFCNVHPNPAAFEICQHRLREKSLLEKLSIPATPYTSGKSAESSLDELGLPLVVKSCGEGYDGKNQLRLTDLQAVRDFDEKLSTQSVYSKGFIIEKYMPFQAEVSIVSCRGVHGDMLHYPVTENVHESGILSCSVAPADVVSEALVEKAEAYAKKIMQELNYVGVLAIEFFLCDEELLVNELAPRVHNSGHWTQAGSKTCQFENHIRAIAGLPLGSTDTLAATAMVNLIGTELSVPELCVNGDMQVHWYNKAVRPGRKLGHINIMGSSSDDAKQRADELMRSKAVLNLA